MTASFEFASPDRIVFGCGRLQEAGSLVREFGSNCLVFTGSNPERASSLVDVLRKAGLLVNVIPVGGEPTFDGVRNLVARARSVSPHVILAMGGGSVIDAGKAVAMLLANGGDPMDYAEVIGRGMPISKSSIPFIAIPTTAGAGAEATRNAVLVDRPQKSKVSLRSHLMLPRLIIIDPQTTVSLSPDVSAATGMDALSQLIEPFVSIKANPTTDAFCRAGIARAARSIRRVCKSPDDIDARTDMSLAAWWSGVALANSGLGAVHGFAAALGGMCDAPHGLICATMLAPVCRANVQALRGDRNDYPALARYLEIARILTGQSNASIEDGISWLAQLAKDLPLRPLKEFGVNNLSSDEIVTATIRSSSMKGNPIALSSATLNNVFREAIA